MPMDVATFYSDVGPVPFDKFLLGVKFVGDEDYTVVIGVTPYYIEFDKLSAHRRLTLPAANDPKLFDGLSYLIGRYGSPADAFRLDVGLVFGAGDLVPLYTREALLVMWTGKNWRPILKGYQEDEAVKDAVERAGVLEHIHPGLAPAGGSTGQVLKKSSVADYDYTWQQDNTSEAGVIGAADIAFTPAGGLEAVNVQAALEELDAEKATSIDGITAVERLKLAGLATRVEYLVHGTGVGDNTIDVAVLATHLKTGSANWDGSYIQTFTGVPPDDLVFIIANNSGFTQTIQNEDVLTPGLDPLPPNFDGYVMADDEWLLFATDPDLSKLAPVARGTLAALGALAYVDTVGTDEIEDAAVTTAKLNTVITPGSHTTDGNIVTLTVGSDGRLTEVVSTPTSPSGGGFVNFDIQPPTTGTTLTPDGNGKQYELENATSCVVTLTTNLTDEGETVINAKANPSGAYTIVADTGLTLNGVAAPGTVTLQDFIGAEAFIKRNGTDFRVKGNLAGDRNMIGVTLIGGVTINNGVMTGTVTVPDNVFTIAKTSGLQTALDAKLALAGGTMAGSVLFAGNAISGNAVLVSTVSGVLTSAHIGQRLQSSGAFTVPTTPTGWWAMMKLGGDHNITFDGKLLDISLLSWGTGDELAILVTSATTIEIKRTAAADIVSQGSFV